MKKNVGLELPVSPFFRCVLVLAYMMAGVRPAFADAFASHRPAPVQYRLLGPHSVRDGVVFVAPNTLLALWSPAAGRLHGPIYYYRSGLPPKPYTGPIAITRGGRQELHFFSEGPLGQRSKETVLTVEIDETAPSAQYLFEPPAVVTAGVTKVQVGTEVSLQARDSGAGVAETYVLVNGARSGGKVVLEQPGLQRLSLVAVDHVGNRQQLPMRIWVD